jgi:lipopolysaccharide assembly protein A
MTTEPQHGPAPPAAPMPRTEPGAEAPQPTPDLAPDGQPPQLPPTAPQQAAPSAALPQHRIKRTRTSGVWVAVGFFAVVLLLLLIFILQNGTQVSVSYLGLHGHLPLGVAMLLSAVCGVLLVVLAGAARIGQLRTVARRHRRADTKHAAAVQASGAPAGPAAR